jgi:glutamine synthetase
MIRIPLGNEKSRAHRGPLGRAGRQHRTRSLYTLLRTGFEGPNSRSQGRRPRSTRTRFLPDNIQDAIRLFKASRWTTDLFGENVHVEVRRAQDSRRAERCPKALGTMVKANEVQFHHEVTNQYLWSKF